MSRFLDRLGQGSATHPWRVIAAWVLGLVAITILAGTAGGEPVDDFRLPGSDAQRAADILDESFPGRAGGDAVVVFAARDGRITDPANAAAVRDTMTAVARLPHVIEVSDPLAPAAVAAGGTITRTEVHYDRPTNDLGTATFEDLDRALAAAHHAGLRAEIGGSLAAWEPVEQVGSEQLGVLVAMVVLLVAFGSFVAMILPIGLALLSVAAGLTLVTVLSSIANVPTSAESIALMIGLGVGIDYSLFVVTRFRALRHAGEPVPQAAGHATATAGMAVLFAGFTVIIAISGLVLSGIWAVGMLGLAAATVVAVTVLAALTLLPALLGLLGPRIDSLQLPWLRRRNPEAHSGVAYRWAHAVVRRPVVAVTAALAVLLVLAAPVFGLRLGQTDFGTQPESTTRRQAFDLLADGYGPGFNGPLVLVATDAAADDPAAIGQLRAAIADDPGVAAVDPPAPNEDGTVTVLQAYPRSAPHDEETVRTVERLRSETIPAATRGGDQDVLVTGETAGWVDLSDQMSQRLPVVIAAVVVLSFVLLTIAFRSLFVALKAAVLNVLSIGVGYGVVIAVFQWGWGKQLIGLSDTVPIVSWVPLMMFAILFGLSMDYEVFLISSIREAHRRTGDTSQAVAEGLGSTARVITAAALIMMAVFGAFVAHPDPVVKMVGLGLAVAILVDATLVRMVLVPGTMVLLGRANWWLPRWLDRILPTIELEGDTTPSATGAAVPRVDTPRTAHPVPVAMPRTGLRAGSRDERVPIGHR
ncbi:MAG TPA: MMPL family transporter [Acidimicrobiales bacterium]|nr:MMPL family transporter [Acidimicrobiales bacterium]